MLEEDADGEAAAADFLAEVRAKPPAVKGGRWVGGGGSVKTKSKM